MQGVRCIGAVCRGWARMATARDGARYANALISLGARERQACTQAAQIRPLRINALHAKALKDQ